MAEVTRHLEEIFKVITDPKKQDYLHHLEPEIIVLMLKTYLTEQEWDKLRPNEHAYNIRSLVKHKAVDFGSNRYNESQEMVSKFTSDPKYLPFQDLLTDRSALSKARHKVLNQHPQHLSILKSYYGMDVIGGIPNEESVRLLVAHDQLVQTPDVAWPTPLPSETYHIPKLYKDAELFINGSSRELDSRAIEGDDKAMTLRIVAEILPTYTASVFFGMESLDRHHKYWEVAID